MRDRSAGMIRTQGARELCFSSDLESIFFFSRGATTGVIYNNYSPKWRWLVVDILPNCKAVR